MDLTQVNAIRSELENVALDMLVVIEGGRLANTIGAKQDATARQIVKRVGNGRDIDGMTEHERYKAETTRRADALRAQWEAMGEDEENLADGFDYDVDEDRLYSNQMAFVGAMIQGGILDEDGDYYDE